MFLSKDQGDLHSRSCPPDLRLVVRVRDVEFSDQSHQEGLHLNEADKQ